MQLPDQEKHIVDILSIGGVISTVVGWLPDIAAFLSIVWAVIRIYETDTVQKWLNKNGHD
jgi:hypothetical protein